VLADEIEQGLERGYFVVGEPRTQTLSSQEVTIMGDSPYVPKQYRVLVVDDDPEWREDLVEVLRSEGMDVDPAAGADEAAPMLKARNYHAAILDKNMNDLTGNLSTRAGIELLDYIREHHPDVSCLILTTNPSIRTYEEAERLGMFGYKEKEDVELSEIVQILAEMFRSRLVTLNNVRGGSVGTDRMYFFGKKGVVTQKVSTETSPDRAGSVKIDNEEWVATTKGMPMAIEIPRGTNVQAYGILNGAIQVAPGYY
jgi:CheY-like chemotaxis protein